MCVNESETPRFALITYRNQLPMKTIHKFIAILLVSLTASVAHAAPQKDVIKNVVRVFMHQTYKNNMGDYTLMVETDQGYEMIRLSYYKGLQLNVMPVTFKKAPAGEAMRAELTYDRAFAGNDEMSVVI